MSRDTRISAAIITHNEADQMRSLVASLGWADEIVVVDSCSEDGTADIARDTGCRVLEQPFDDFASQRNRALAETRNTWVLSIDADERPERGFEIEARRLTEARRCAGLRVPIRSKIFGRRFRFCGTQHDRPVRLFRRDACKWVEQVHERLTIDGQVKTMHRGLAHETIRDVDEFLLKMKRYTTLEATARVQRGEKPLWCAPWYGAAREAIRRLGFHLGVLDGPAGIAFGILSGYSEWTLAQTHRRLHREATSEPIATFGVDAAAGLGHCSIPDSAIGGRT